jgi:SAM-dependent methyltransferase
MRLDVVPDNILERLVLLMGIVPTPLVQVSWGMASASTIIAGARLGVFEALDGVELSPAELAAQLHTHPLATETLLNGLCGFGCIDRRDGRYRDSALARKWLAPGSKDSLHDAVLLLGLLQDGFADLERVVRTGEILDWHHGDHGEEIWGPYLRGLGKLAKLPAGEVARRVKLGSEARRLLDVGGGHGQWSVAFCERHPQLEATVLDLSPAVPIGETLVAEAGMGERVRYRAGDLRSAHWGEGWDAVLLFNVIHNLAPEECEAAVRRARAALKPGGRFVILEAEHRHVRDRIAQAAAFAEIMCFMTSGTRAYPEATMRGWVEQAGFSDIRVWRPRFGPYMVVIEAAA